MHTAVSISAGNNAVDGSYSRGPPSRRRKSGARRCTYARLHGYTWLEFSPIRIRYSTLLASVHGSVPLSAIYTVPFSTVPFLIVEEQSIRKEEFRIAIQLSLGLYVLVLLMSIAIKERLLLIFLYIMKFYKLISSSLEV